jgi:hypothetical protein
MYIEELLQKKLQFEFKHVGLKWGVFESTKIDGVHIEIGCVYIGDAANCRKYVEQRRAKRALKEEELRGRNPLLNTYDRPKDGVTWVKS